MSYHIVKSIVVDEIEKKVYITGSDNNVYPRTPHKWECTSLSRMLVEDGKEAVEIEIMQEYENGNFQGNCNKWTRALKALRLLPEYEAFNWRGEPFDEITERRKTDAFKALLKKALTLKLPAPLKFKDGMIIKLKVPLKFTSGVEGQIFKVHKVEGSRKLRFSRYFEGTSGTLLLDTYSIYRFPASYLEGAKEYTF